MSGLCELVHSLDSESAAKRLDDAGPRPGEPRRRGVEVGDRAGGARARSSRAAPARSAACRRCRRSPTTRRRRGRTSGASASWPSATGCGALDGHDPGLPGRRRGGSDLVRVGSAYRGATDSAASGANIPCSMGFSDVWNRTLVYFGIAEEDDEDWDEDGYATERGARADVRGATQRAAAVAAPAPTATSSTTGPIRSRRRQPGPRPRRSRAGSAPSSRRWPAHLRTRRCACTSSSRAASTTRNRSPTASRTTRP